MTIRKCRKAAGPRESEIQKAITDWLDARGIFWWRMPVGPVMQGTGFKCKNKLKGFPDLAGIMRPTGRMFVIEVKRPGGKLSTDQELWLANFQQRGAFCIVAYSLEDVALAFDAWVGRVF